jgi:hypothetical protein
MLIIGYAELQIAAEPTIGTIRQRWDNGGTLFKRDLGLLFSHVSRTCSVLEGAQTIAMNGRAPSGASIARWFACDGQSGTVAAQMCEA